MDGCPGYAVLTALGILCAMDPFQVRGLLSLQSAVDEGYSTPASLHHEWSEGSWEARIVAAVAVVALLTTEPRALSLSIVLLQLAVIFSSLAYALPAATEAEALLRTPGLNLADFYLVETARACLASGRFAGASATVSACTATVFAHRSFRSGDDGAQQIIRALVVIWVGLAPALSWYNCGWWCEWRKVASYILFFTWAICFLSVLDLVSTESASCGDDGPKPASTQSVRCLVATAASGSPGAMLQVLLLMLGSLSFLPTLFLDERLHARTTEFRAAMVLKDPLTRLEEVAQVEEGLRAPHPLNVDPGAAVE